MLVTLVQLLGDSRLALQRQISHQIGKTFSRNGRGWHETHELVGIVVIIIQASVEPLLSECNYCLLKPVLEFVRCMWFLDLERISEISVLLRFPLIASINLVESYNERAFLLSEQLDGLESLLLETMHEIDDENGDITKGGTTRTQVGERLVTWCVDDEVTWQLQINVDSAIHSLDVPLNVVLGEVSGTNLLSDTSSLSSLHIGLS